MNKKQVLLMAGGGTLGSYTAKELLRLGYQVDIIALEDLHSLNRNLNYIKGMVTDEMLLDLFAKKHYDAIVDFVLYTDPKAYEKRADLLLANTDQLIFLSSYRTFADEEHPIRESSPQWLDVTKDEYMLEHEDYAIPKSHCERYLRSLPNRNWTIIRPVISFSHFRLDLITIGAGQLLRGLEGKKILAPEACRNNFAGLSWAGDCGKLIARLVCNPKAMGEDFIIGTGESRTWQEVADMYTEMLGCEFVWVDTETYLENATGNGYMTRCSMFFDRILDRTYDATKILTVTGTKPEDITGVRAGLIHELEILSSRPDLMARFDSPGNRKVNEKMDAYLAAHNL